MKNILYKRDKKGKLMSWTIHYDNASYLTEYGYVDGVLTKTLPTFVQQKNIGKINETSIEEQVLLEVKSKIQYQLDHGYTYEIPQFDKKFEVSLAEKYIDRVEKNKLDFPYICQPKYDGIRCTIQMEDGVLTLKSRTGKKFYACPHLISNSFICKLFEIYPNMILDGELYNHDLKSDFNKIVSIVKKVKINENDIIESEAFIRYYIFDVYFPNKKDLSYSERNHILKIAYHELAKNDFSSSYYEMVYDFNDNDAEGTMKYIAKNKQDVENYLNEFVTAGYEGIMLKKDEPYFFGRSTSMLKYKQFKDEEYTIVDILDGKGNLAGIASSIVCTDNYSNTFKAGLMGTQEFAKEIFDNKNSYIGKKATVKYQELTPVKNGKGGVPRFGKIVTIRDYE